MKNNIIVFSYYFSLSVLFLFNLAIVSMAIIICKNRHILTDEKFVARYGTLVEGLKTKGFIA
jgi:hypothetical protein